MARLRRAALRGAAATPLFVLAEHRLLGEVRVSHGAVSFALWVLLDWSGYPQRVARWTRR